MRLFGPIKSAERLIFLPFFTERERKLGSGCGPTVEKYLKVFFSQLAMFSLLCHLSSRINKFILGDRQRSIRTSGMSIIENTRDLSLSFMVKPLLYTLRGFSI